MKGKVTASIPERMGGLRVSLAANCLNAPAQAEVDLVVLASGMVPNSADGPGSAPCVTPTAKLGAQRVGNTG